jgi:DNA-binding response OmpR family regulator
MAPSLASMPALPRDASPTEVDPVAPSNLDAAMLRRSQLRALAARLEQANMRVRDPDIATVCIEVARELRSISGARVSQRLFPAEVQRKLDLPLRQSAILLIHLLGNAGAAQAPATLAEMLSVKATRTDVVRVYVHGLRAALARQCDEELIQTRYGRGYLISQDHAAMIRRLLD